MQDIFYFTNWHEQKIVCCSALSPGIVAVITKQYSFYYNNDINCNVVPKLMSKKWNGSATTCFAATIREHFSVSVKLDHILLVYQCRTMNPVVELELDKINKFKVIFDTHHRITAKFILRCYQLRKESLYRI